jgi:hypothetical protein
MREARARYSDMTRRGGALNAGLRPRRTPRGDHHDDSPDAVTTTPVRASSSSPPADASSSPRALHPAAADALRRVDALARRVGLPRATARARGTGRPFPAEAETRAAADRALEAERLDAERHRDARVAAKSQLPDRARAGRAARRTIRADKNQNEGDDGDDGDDVSSPARARAPRERPRSPRPEVADDAAPRRVESIETDRRRTENARGSHSTSHSTSTSTSAVPNTHTPPTASSPATPFGFVVRGAADAALESARAALARAADADARLMRAAVAPTPAPTRARRRDRTRREWTTPRHATREGGKMDRRVGDDGGCRFESSSSGDGSEDRREDREGEDGRSFREERDGRRGEHRDDDDPFAAVSLRRAETAARRVALAERVRRWKNGKPDAGDGIRTDDGAAAAKARASAATLARALRRLERAAANDDTAEAAKTTTASGVPTMKNGVPSVTTGVPTAARARAPATREDLAGSSTDPHPERGVLPSERGVLPSERLSSRACASPPASIERPASFRIPTRDETLDVVRAMEERARSRHAETVAGPDGAAAWMVRRAERNAGPGAEQNADDDAATAAVRGLRRLNIARIRNDAGTRSDEERESSGTRNVAFADDASDADSAGLSPPTRPRRDEEAADEDGAHSDDEGAYSASPPTRPPPFATRISPAEPNSTAVFDDDACSDAPDDATFADDETGRLRHVKDFESLMAYAFD